MDIQFTVYSVSDLGNNRKFSYLKIISFGEKKNPLRMNLLKTVENSAVYCE